METRNDEQRSLVDQWLVALDDADWNTRATAIRMLGELGERAPVEPLLAALHDVDESVRAAAVRALGKLGERAPLDRVVAALHDVDWTVREMAALTLGELGERAPAEPLVALLRTGDEDTVVREAALLALQHTHPDAISSLDRQAALPRHDWSPLKTDQPRQQLNTTAPIHLLDPVKRLGREQDGNQNWQEERDAPEGADLDATGHASPPRARLGPGRRSLPRRIAEGMLAALLVLGIGLSWLVIAHTLHPTSSGPTSQVRSTPTPPPVVSTNSGENDMSLTVVNNVVYAGAYGGAVSALRENTGGLLWQYRTDGSVYTAPLVVNGVVYVTAYVDNGPSHVYALRASDGKLLWSYTRNSYVPSPLVVEGVAYLASADGLLAALRADDGSVLWHREIPSGQGVSLAGVVNGVLYGATYENQGPGHVEAWRASDGSLLWQSRASLYLLDVIDGVVYASLGNDVEALQANTGAVLWHTTLDGSPSQMPLIVSNGVVYATATVNNLSGTTAVPAHGGGYDLETIPLVPEKQFTSSVYALRATDGAVLWHYKGQETNGLPSGFIVSDGTVFGCTEVVTGVSTTGGYITAGYVYALQGNTGALLWSYAIPHNQSVVITVAHGVIYVGSDDAFYALQASTGSLLWRSPLDAAVTTTPVVDGGVIYVGANNGITSALQSSNGSLRWRHLTTVSGS